MSLPVQISRIDRDGVIPVQIIHMYFGVNLGDELELCSDRQRDSTSFGLNGHRRG